MTGPPAKGIDKPVYIPALSDPAAAAKWATLSRIITCIVTERMVDCIFIPREMDLDMKDHNLQFRSPSFAPHVVGLALVLVHPPADVDSNHNMNGQKTFSVTADNVLLAIPLVGQPVPLSLHHGNNSDIYSIGWLDPMDMLPIAFSLIASHSNHKDPLESYVIATVNRVLQPHDRLTVEVYDDPLVLWNHVKTLGTPDPKIREEMVTEFASSMQFQEWTYRNPPPLPNLNTSTIDWEQSIMTGHQTHPMHRARIAVPPVKPLLPGEETERLLKRPKIRVVAMKTDEIECTFPDRWHPAMSRFLEAAIKSSGLDISSIPIPDGDRVLIPVHEIQIPNFIERFPSAFIYPPEISLDALGQQSVRTVQLGDTSILPWLSLKVAIGVKLTSALRTIFQPPAYSLPRICEYVLPYLTYDREKVKVLRELASVSSKDKDPHIAKHCAAYLRELPGIESEGEILIVSTALMEWGHGGAEPGVPAVVSAFGLDTVKKRVEWFDSYAGALIECFMPPVVHNGFTFEPHQQNTLARFEEIAPHRLLGFYIRDSGGNKLHQPTLEKSTGVTFDGDRAFYRNPEGLRTLTKDLDTVYARTYNCIVVNHLQQMTRVLGLHYSGVGYAIMRRHFARWIPEDHELWKAWLGCDIAPGVSFMKMRLNGVHLYEMHLPIPNLVNYRGVEPGNIYDKD